MTIFSPSFLSRTVERILSRIWSNSSGLLYNFSNSDIANTV